MKEAAGEANMIVLVIVLIAIVAAVATPLITNLMKSVSNKACCTDAGGTWSGGTCTKGSNAYYDKTTYDNCIKGTEKK